MIWWYALALALLLKQSAAQTCAGSVLAEYMDCVAQNPCECSACDPDPTDEFPVITAERPSDCLDVARVFCPLIRCCSICEAQALAWNQCSANGFSANYLGRECPLQGSCASYSLQDVDCTPSTSPSESPITSPTAVPIAVPTAAPTSEPTAAAVPLDVSESPTASSSDLPTVCFVRYGIGNRIHSERGQDIFGDFEIVVYYDRSNAGWILVLIGTSSS
jgi:hypothetical protein